eukprot:357281-Chlamydomonas_euryale.AAC.11
MAIQKKWRGTSESWEPSHGQTPRQAQPRAHPCDHARNTRNLKDLDAAIWLSSGRSGSVLVARTVNIPSIWETGPVCHPACLPMPISFQGSLITAHLRDLGLTM